MLTKELVIKELTVQAANCNEVLKKIKQDIIYLQKNGIDESCRMNAFMEAIKIIKDEETPDGGS